MSPPEVSSLACQKERFSLPEGCHYLNCAYMSPLSKRVQEAGIAGVRRKAAPAKIRPDDFFTGCEEIRGLFARLVNAPDPARVAIIPAVSYGLATVARNTPVGRGQNIVTVQHQFPSNVHIWRRVCASTDSTFRVVSSPTGAGAGEASSWNEAILEAIDGDTAIVAVGPLHWTDGTRFDLARIGERAREVGAAFIIDGTQAVGAEPFDVQELQPDALICAAYKWLTGPYSIGAAYLGPRYDDGVPLEETWQGKEGSEDFAGLVEQGTAYRPGAARYDVGETANFVLVPMFIAALEQLLEWGVVNIQGYIRGLTRGLLQGGRLEELGLGVARPHGEHLFGLHLPEDIEVRQVQARLRERDVFVSVRGSVIRVSPHIYNEPADIDALVDALSSAR
jgi:selenocysteine lyase/cysteine desulfurase